jgi:hypothetical protein
MRSCAGFVLHALRSCIRSFVGSVRFRTCPRASGGRGLLPPGQFPVSSPKSIRASLNTGLADRAAALQIPAEGGRKISPNLTKLLKTHAKPGKAAKNNREEQERLAGAEQEIAGNSRRSKQATADEPSRSPGEMKDEAKDEVVIVFMGRRVEASPRKRAQPVTCTGKRPAKNPARCPAGLAAHFSKITLCCVNRDSCQENSSESKFFREQILS